jgi:hypothetical protein
MTDYASFTTKFKSVRHKSNLKRYINTPPFLTNDGGVLSLLGNAMQSISYQLTAVKSGLPAK